MPTYIYIFFVHHGTAIYSISFLFGAHEGLCRHAAGCCSLMCSRVSGEKNCSLRKSQAVDKKTRIHTERAEEAGKGSAAAGLYRKGEVLEG